MQELLLVCAGGAFGSGARYLVQTFAARVWGPDWPRGTLIVNVVGSFLLGAIASSLGGRPGTEHLRLLLGAGIMGGFTTYSSFNAETLQLWASGRPVAAAAYLAGTVLTCLVAGIAGLSAGRAIAS
ncbi:MAG: CrcB family protein [Anaeromyxobacter sp.]